MNTELLVKVEQQHMRRVPEITVGDQVEVHTIVREKNRQRIQVFKGLIIAIKGSGVRKTFTVRKISAGIGVEKIFPLHSPNIKKIVVTRKGNVSRSKLYYLRQRIGKKALKVKVSEGAVLEDFYAQPEESEEAEVVEEVVEAADESAVEIAAGEDKKADETTTKESTPKAEVVEKEEKVEQKPAK